MRRIVLFVSTIVLAASLVIIVSARNNATQTDTSDAVEMPEVSGLTTKRSITINIDSFPELPSGTGTAESANTILPEWRELHGQNNDFVGWLKLGDTVIDYPVVQYTDNVFYLHHALNKQPFYDGTLFVDSHTPIIDSRRPDNTVIYGHNLNSGKKFAHLVRYYATPGGWDLTAYIANPTVEFNTVYDNERSTYKIFAGMYVNTEEVHGEVFNYFQRRFFRGTDEFYDFVGNVMDRSVFYTDVDIEYGDEFLTLSTCYYHLGNDTDRFVLVARRVREGESCDVDTDAAYINPSPKYFDYYYQVKGGGWKGRNWDTSKVKGFNSEN